jgi:tRNA (guanine37-N1)-methyltransferase
VRVDVITLFPEMFSPLDVSIPGRAQKAGAIEIKTHQIRQHAINKHGQVDDVPYGGEAGMVLRPEPLAAALDKVLGEIAAVSGSALSSVPSGPRPHVVFMSAQGRLFDQKRAGELAALDNVVIVCGHYKGVDQRFLDAHVDEEISVGDYVLSGGELPAMIVIDAIARLLPGVIGDRESAETDSFYNPGRLGWPVYTRPAEFGGRAVPEVLLSGHHANIVAWRTLESLRLTEKNRPDLLEKHGLTAAEDRLVNPPPPKIKKKRKITPE